MKSRPTYTEALLGLLSYYSGGSKIVWSYLYSNLPPSIRQTTPPRTLQSTLYRLKKRGMVESRNKGWKITVLGKKHLAKLKAKKKLPPHSSKQKSGRQKKRNLIVMFDIPETKKRVRPWLRTELLAMGFTVLQKSVWIGPAPLSEEFIRAVDEFGLLPDIKFFKVSETEVI